MANARRTSTLSLVPRPPTSTHQWLARQLNTQCLRRRLDVARRASALSASHSFESAGSIHEVPVYLRAHLCSSCSWPICEELVLRRRPGLSAAALYRRRAGRFVMRWRRQTTIEEASSSTVSACFACPATAALSRGIGGRRGVATAARRFETFLLLTPLGAPTPPLSPCDEVKSPRSSHAAARRAICARA